MSSIHMEQYPYDFDPHDASHLQLSIPPTGAWIACLWTTWGPIQYLASGEPFLRCTIDRKFKSPSRFGPPLGRVTLYPLDENKNWWNRKPYVRCIICCIENITWKSPMWNTPGGLRRKIAKKGPKWLFLAVLRP